MITAFQPTAFQNNAFQIGVEVSGGGGKWTPYAYGLLRARLAEAERDRKEKEEAEAALASVSVDVLEVIDAPIITAPETVEAAARVTLGKLVPKAGPDLELIEFQKFMQLLADLECDETWQ